MAACSTAYVNKNYVGIFDLGAARSANEGHLQMLFEVFEPVGLAREPAEELALHHLMGPLLRVGGLGSGVHLFL